MRQLILEGAWWPAKVSVVYECDATPKNAIGRLLGGIVSAEARRLELKRSSTAAASQDVPFPDPMEGPVLEEPGRQTSIGM